MRWRKRLNAAVYIEKKAQEMEEIVVKSLPVIRLPQE